MTETKLKFVKFSSTFRRYFSSAGRNYRENTRAALPTAVRTAYCVIASNSVFSNRLCSTMIAFILMWYLSD